jgi:tRNA threonylcarbamoyladenosine biosynthesis protein TsaB
MTTVLAFDTATAVTSVAVIRGEAVLAETLVNCHRLHSERLLETMRWVLREAGLGLAEIDLLAVSAGPGSFTGLRIGAATAKGLAFAAQKPLIAVPTLDALAANLPLQDGTLCVLIDARMREVYGAAYRFAGGARETVVPAGVGALERLLEQVAGDVYLMGDAVAPYREQILARLPQARLLPERVGVPRASSVAAEALELLRRGAVTDPALMAPVYLRQSHAEMARAAQA